MALANETDKTSQPSDPQSTTGFEIYRFSEAPTLGETEHMSLVNTSPEFIEGLGRAIEAGFDEGNEVKTLFSMPGFSLTYAWFKSGFPLPLHSHNSDCLYFIISGTLQLGTETLGKGDGFFVGADKAYRYVPGDDGVEILEFRTVENFNIDFKVPHKAWAKIASDVASRREGWGSEERPA